MRTVKMKESNLDPEHIRTGKIKLCITICFVNLGAIKSCDDSFCSHIHFPADIFAHVHICTDLQSISNQLPAVIQVTTI